MTKPTAHGLKGEIAAYEAVRSELESESLGKWSLFHSRRLVKVFETFEEAATEAVRRFGRGPYLIRQIGSSTGSLPASVMFRPLNGPN
jgi:hypothetical protein